MEIKSGNKIKNRLQVLNITGGSNSVKCGNDYYMVTKWAPKGVKKKAGGFRRSFFDVPRLQATTKNVHATTKGFKYLKLSSAKLSAYQ